MPTFRIAKSWHALFWAAALLYTAVHFWYSGIHQPRKNPSFYIMLKQVPPLIEHMKHGGPVRAIDRPQYGPVFYFIMQPVLAVCGDDPLLLVRWMHALQLLALVIAFFFCISSIRLWLAGISAPRSPPLPFLMMLLALLWLNFSPMYYIVAISTPELWELALISSALYAYLRGRRFLASFLLCAAALLKVLPLALLLYFAVRDRRALWYSAISILLLLSAGQWLYGWQMGYGYPLSIVRNMFGMTFNILWHENVSLKAMVVRLFSGFNLPPGMHDTVIDDGALSVANAVAQGMQVAGIGWVVWMLARMPPPQAEPQRSRDIVWGWSLLSAAVLLFAPFVSFEYMTLCLLALSVVCVLFAIDPALRRDRWAVASFAMALLLVATPATRQVINHLLPLAAIGRLAGTTHLTLSETYQYFGFPTLGMAGFLVTLWLVRRRLLGLAEGKEASHVSASPAAGPVVESRRR